MTLPRVLLLSMCHRHILTSLSYICLFLWYSFGHRILPITSSTVLLPLSQSQHYGWTGSKCRNETVNNRHTGTRVKNWTDSTTKE